MTDDGRAEDLWREAAPRVLARLVRRYGSGRFDLCEDAVQEALLDAYRQWPSGLPDDPLGWLTSTARRRYVDRVRSDTRRRDREERAVRLDAPVHPPVHPEAAERDDSLLVLQLCCHPELPRSGRVALTLRAVAGLSTAQIAGVYQVPERTIAQRITRAKRALAAVGRALPRPEHAAERLTSVLDVLYVMFTEAHHTTGGSPPRDADLAAEAIRLGRALRLSLPDSAEVAGLLALMLLTEARQPARIGRGGVLRPLDEQDRSLWDRALIDEGTALVERTVPGVDPGPYLLQACIAAVHADAPDTDRTDWHEILVLYRLLEAVTGHANPTIALNRIVAHAMVHGDTAGLAALGELDAASPGLPRLDAVRAHLLERSGRADEAVAAYRRAIAAADNLAEQRHLRDRMRRLAPGED
ncbi:RNA polymerase sigma factor [Prauserella alba]|uniref:Sigma factor-like helix-turn-helix DNA-binding protein n=1 Tax=Prauserella alba TaxID=176898 RepID=A0ABP4G3X4_9PSEU|nr:sigma-70 family RNA polymerase sigma factor [Prauserella alba]MCP2179992.1 RNA polymerase, sigma subunit, ECF family [Prauserella alba]